MANPQLENGYTAIANEILDALCRIRVPGEATQVLMAILRKTYGFKRKEDEIALSQICTITKLKKPTVCRAINTLEKMNLIGKKVSGKNGNILAINKDHDSWKPLSKKIMPKRRSDVIKKDNAGVSKMITKIIENDNASLSKMIPTKETTTKTTVKTITTNVVRRSANPYVDELLKSLKDKLGTDTLDGSEKINRRYAWLLLGKCGYKNGAEKAAENAKNVIKLAFRDNFHAGNATSMRYVYNNAVKIVATERQKVVKSNIIGL